jgi:hypothetical protein
VVSVGNRPTIEAASDITWCTTVVIGSTDLEAGAIAPDDGLIRAVVVIARGVGTGASAAVIAVRAPLGVGPVAANVAVTESADTVELGWMWADPVVAGVGFDPDDVVALVSDSAVSTLLAAVMPSDVVTVVLAPPLACTVPSRGSGGDSGAVDPVSDPDAVAVVATAAVVGSVAATAPGSFRSGVESCWVPEDSDSEVDPADAVVSGSATATPGAVATATPIPSATANAPTRPT